MIGIKNLKINLESLILNSDKVIIFPHKDADFDAIASSIGVSLISNNLKVDNHIVIGDSRCKLYHGVQTIIDQEKDNFSIINLNQYEKEKTDNSLNVLCDVNKPQLTWVNKFDKDKLVVIDHHDKDNQTFESKLEYINTKTSSASEIITCLLHSFKIEIPNNIANILLAGVLLDTNRLSNHVSSDTLRNVAMLIDYGASMECANAFFCEDLKSERKVQELINRKKIINYSIGLILGDEEKEYTKEELARAANELIKNNVDSAYAIGNIGDGIISISARSKDSVNVGNVMRELDGGGNQCSGATKLKDLTIEEAGNKLLKLVLPSCFELKQTKNTK